MNDVQLTAHPDDKPQRPDDMGKAIAAASLRMHGWTQADAAMRVGITERTLRNYEGCTWWRQVQALAETEAINDIRVAARAANMRLLAEDDGATVRFNLERLVEAFAPPATRAHVQQAVTVTVAGGEPTEDGY